MASAVELKDVRYAYPYTTEPVLNGANLRIEEGQKVLLIGPSGCGKTTLLFSINGIIPKHLGGHFEGEVLLFDKSTSKSTISEVAKDVQMVMQNPDEQLTCLYVEDEVAFGPENLRLPQEEIGRRIDENLGFTGLSKFREKVVYDLSGGQKQRLAIASVLSMRPRILILDNPISNLDPLGAMEILSVIQKISAERGLTTIIAEHNIEKIVPLVDRIVVMNAAGQVVRDCAPREAMRDGLFLQEELGLWIPEVSEAALRLNARVQIDDVPFTVEQGVRAFSGLVKPVEHGRADTIRRGVVGAGEPLVVVENLSFSYPDGTTALKRVSLTIGKGDIAAIVGQNGSGKSTLALNLAGILRPSEGRVSIGGKDIQKIPTKQLAKEVAYVFQYPEHQFIMDSIRDEVAFEVRKKGLIGKEEEDETRRILDEIGMWDLRDRHPYDLSLGEKRRLSVAVMIIADPATIILDEPTYGQDRKYNYQLMTYVSALNRKGTTVTFITHSMRMVAEYATKVFLMSDGRILYSGEPRDFFTRSELLKDASLERPAITELSFRLFNEPLLSVEEFANRILSSSL